MANKTINQLTSLGSVDANDEFVLYDVSEGATKKATKSNLLNLDNYPTSGSSNPAKSGGIFSANAVIMSSSTTITNAPIISSGSIIRVMFTSAITGSDTSTALSLTYNNTAYTVKVGKQGSLSNFVASDISGTYTYLQAYTTLELAFDGTQFIIIGNPVVLSSSGYTIYADGQKKDKSITILTGSSRTVTMTGRSDWFSLAFPTIPDDKIAIQYYVTTSHPNTTATVCYTSSENPISVIIIKDIGDTIETTITSYVKVISKNF